MTLKWLAPNRWAVVGRYQRYSVRWGRWITVPDGTQTDLASVPRLALPLIDDDDLAPAAVIHDYLYRSPWLHGRPTRKMADKIMRDLMTEDGVPGWKRRLVYWAVRAFGGRAWRKEGKYDCGV